MKKLEASDVKKLLTRNKSEYAEQLSGLKKGEAISIEKSEWKKKTSPYVYFNNTFNRKRGRKSKKIVSIRKTDDTFLIIKMC